MNMGTPAFGASDVIDVDPFDWKEILDQGGDLCTGTWCAGETGSDGGR